jgi:O-antigen/teichoic acid export membrane protein
MSLLTSDAREVGYFVTSTRVVEMLAGIPFLLISVVLPVLSVAARDDRERLEYITARTTEALALGGVLLALVLWIAAKPVIVVLGGQQYDPAVPVLQIQCLASVTIFLAAAWNPALIGLGRTRELAAAVGMGLLVVLVAGLILIPRMGADGAAIAAVVGDLAYAVAMFAALWRAGPGRKLDFRGLARVGAAALPAIGLGLVPGVPDVLLAVAAATLFLCLAVALHAVPSELAAGVRQLLRAVLRRGSARPGDS